MIFGSAEESILFTKGKYSSSAREEGLQLMLKDQIYSGKLKAAPGLLPIHDKNIRLEILKKKKSFIALKTNFITITLFIFIFKMDYW